MIRSVAVPEENILLNLNKFSRIVGTFIKNTVTAPNGPIANVLKNIQQKLATKEDRNL
jgi:hypothetical protein